MKNIMQTRLRMLLAAFLLSATSSFVVAQNDVNTVQHDNTRIRELTFSGNGKFLIAKSGDEVVLNQKGIVTSPSITLWEVDSRRKMMNMAEKEIGRASCISNDGSFFAFRESSREMRDKNMINVMDMTTKKVTSVVRFTDNKFSRPLFFLNENKSLLIEQGTRLMIYDITIPEAKFEREFTGSGTNHYLSTDDAYFLEQYVDSINVIDFKTIKQITSISCRQGNKPEEIKNVIFSPDNRFVATLSLNKVRLWDLMSSKVAHQFTIGEKEEIFCFTPDGRYLVGGNDTIKLYELRSKRAIVTPIVCEGKISTAAISPDSRYLVCGDSKGYVKTWNFSDENVANLYFNREIQNEVAQIPLKKEFEKTDDYNKRVQKLKRSIQNKYLGQYIEKISTERTIQETWAEEDERREDERRTLIAQSRQELTFRIDSISAYNADRETFMIKIVNDQERYSKVEAVKVPLRDNAPCFKQRFQSLEVKGIKQLSDDLVTYEIFNVKIRSNCSGKDKEYTFGQQKRTSEE